MNAREGDHDVGRDRQPGQDAGKHSVLLLIGSQDNERPLESLHLPLASRPPPVSVDKHLPDRHVVEQRLDRDKDGVACEKA